MISWLIFGILIISCISSQSSKYFNQKVAYDIEVSLDTGQKKLRGFINIKYFNNSPDTLHFIWIHLWPNAYKNTNTEFANQHRKFKRSRFLFSLEEERGWIDSLAFKVNGIDAKFNFHPHWMDVGKIDLNLPLKPKDSITISTPFVVKLPKVFSRLGWDSLGYYITQWYPKPAVYDNKGWHPIPYLDIGEFYSEFGSFSVKIKTPKGFTVAATGILINKENQEDGHLWHFIADSVHDFAWFASNKWIEVKDTLKLPISGRIIEVKACYYPQDSLPWKNAIYYLKNAILYYSKWVGEYPYPQATAVDGALSAGGGMEYPMITIISSSPKMSEEMLGEVIIHEIGHIWFYGILASNEREYPWMDEGINTFYEFRTSSEVINKDKDTSTKNQSLSNIRRGITLKSPTQLPKSHKQINHKKSWWITPYNIISLMHGLRLKEPAGQHSQKYNSETSYGLFVYYETSFLFNYLKEYLGDEIFDKCMQEYYKKWSFKHPYPQDIKNTLEECSGKKLDWFFALLENSQWSDYSITKCKKNPDSLIISIKNKSPLNVPFPLALLKSDSIIMEKWIEPSQSSNTLSVSLPNIDADAICIDPFFLTPDKNYINNSIKLKAPLKKPLNIAFPILSNSYLFAKRGYTNIKVFPWIGGWTKSGGFNFGLAFHNIYIPLSNVLFAILPIYQINSKQLGGFFHLEYFNGNSLKNRFNIGIAARSFTYDQIENKFYRYIRVAPFIEFFPFEASGKFSITPLLIIQEAPSQNAFKISTSPTKIKIQNNYFYLAPLFDVSFSYTKTDAIFSYIAQINTRTGYQYIKTSLSSGASFQYLKSNYLFLRFYLGYVPKAPSSFLMNSLTARKGIDDITFDNLYLSRTSSNKWYDNFIYFTEGFILPANSYQNNYSKWLISGMSLLSIPVISKILPTYAFYSLSLLENFQYEYNWGLALGSFQKYLNPGTPSYATFLALSKLLKKEKFLNSIYFAVNFSIFSPFYQIRNIKL